jgi:hypothetical protein
MISREGASFIDTSREDDNESSSIGQENVCEMQNHPPQGCGTGDLREPEAQATARLIGEVSGGTYRWR